MLVFAHRGASGNAPDNSLKAFQQAIAAGTKALESDVRATLDGRLVFFHDSTVKVRGKIPVRASLIPASKYLTMDIGEGEYVPLVSDVFEHFQRAGLLHEITWSLDIPGNKEFNRLARISNQYGIAKNIFACNTTSTALVHWRRVAPAMLFVWSVRIRQLEHLGVNGVIETCKKRHVDVLNIKLADVTQDLVNAARNIGMKVFIWDVHDESKLKAATAFKPDAIYTNHPEKVIDGTWKA
nr:glycerophosphodiester phosphodiesterase family protein [Candidatus Sigynarchaeota archaeon]